MLFNELNDDNFILFAIKNYENPQAVTKEDFDKDLNHFKYIKRLLKRYKNTGVLKSHLLLNHFIILYNIWGEATTPMLFFKIDKDLWPAMKTFIMFLNRFPEYPKTHIHDIQVDLECLKELNLIVKTEETEGTEKDNYFHPCQFNCMLIQLGKQILSSIPNHQDSRPHCHLHNILQL